MFCELQFVVDLNRIYCNIYIVIVNKNKMDFNINYGIQEPTLYKLTN